MSCIDPSLIAKCAERGMTRSEAASHLNYPYSSICKWARESGICFTSLRGKPKTTSLRDAEIIALGRSMMTLYEIGELYGISRARVSQIIRRSGVERITKRTKSKADPFRIAECAKQGMTRSETATHLDYPICAVNRAARELQICFVRRYGPRLKCVKRKEEDVAE